ncbi:MAG: hypothetical protein JNK76_18050 [Planctomycetales bacterium]|nr:hypothetical protein [Planctomycetales bacterium]MBN8624175.1 hypothetical protein [Planctomycetota bacterium]
MHLHQNPSDDEILRFVEEWIDDLARDDYAAAFRRTDHDPYYRWTPELMRLVVQGYGLPEPHRSGAVFAVTARASALGGPPQRVVDRDVVRPHCLAEIWYDLPLNGTWSDLTATFRVELRAEVSAVILQEIHVF